MADHEELVRRLRARHNPDFNPKFSVPHHRAHHQRSDEAADTIELLAEKADEVNLTQAANRVFRQQNERLSSDLAAAQHDLEHWRSQHGLAEERLRASHQREEQMRRQVKESVARGLEAEKREKALRDAAQDALSALELLGADLYDPEAIDNLRRILERVEQG